MALDVDVRLAKGQVQSFKTEDVSLGGAFLCSKQPPMPGTELLLRLHLPGGVFTANSRVIHVLDEISAIGKERAAGFGVAFRELSPPAEEALKQLFQQQKMDAWKLRAEHGLAMARRGFRATLDKVREKLVTPEETPTDAIPWYQRARAAADNADAAAAPSPAVEAAPAVPAAPPEAPAASQLRDLVVMARDHEKAGEFEEARHMWLCAHELVKKHPELGTLMDEALLSSGK